MIIIFFCLIIIDTYISSTCGRCASVASCCVWGCYWRRMYAALGGDGRTWWEVLSLQRVVRELLFSGQLDRKDAVDAVGQTSLI